MRRRGVIICFEGGEGCGKTTQAKRLYAELKKRNLPAVLLREPGGTPLGEKIRRLILNFQDAERGRGAEARNDAQRQIKVPKAKLSPLEEFLLFSIARAHLVRNAIFPALEEGRIVILDRYFYSSYAYQGSGGLDLRFMRMVTEKLLEDAYPDIAFYLDVPPEIGLKRKAGASSRKDRFQNKNLAFHRRVRRAFLALAKEEAERFVVLDARAPAQEVFRSVLEAVEKLLRRKGFCA